MESSKVIFLDRDGILNIDNSYVYKPEDFQFVEGAIDVLRKLQQEYKLIIITNQGGIAKNKYTLEQMKEFNNHLINEYSKEGIKFEGIYYCDHHPNLKCECRKPKIGMFEQAMNDFNIDMTKSWTIGDKLTDCIAGKKAGTKTILLKSKYFDANQKNSDYADYLIKNVREIEKII